MKNKKIIRFVESLILLPITMSSLPASAVNPVAMNMVPTPQAVLSEKINKAADLFINNTDKEDDEESKQAEAAKAKAEAIDAYFESKAMPMRGYGAKLAIEAEKNGLDWRLVAAIAVRESTGGKFACKRVANNPFGWGSCKIGFKSMDESIETIARNLGGNNPKTAHHYDNKTTLQILHAYNPPSVVPKYAEQVISIMDAIGKVEVGGELATNVSA